MRKLSSALLLALAFGCAPQGEHSKCQSHDRTGERPKDRTNGPGNDDIGEGGRRPRPAEEYVTGAAFSPDNRFVLVSYTAEYGGYQIPEKPRGMVLWGVEAGKPLWVG